MPPYRGGLHRSPLGSADPRSVSALHGQKPRCAGRRYRLPDASLSGTRPGMIKRRNCSKRRQEYPKGMLGVGPQKRPFLDYLLLNAREAGIATVVFVIGATDETITRHYGRIDGRPYPGLTSCLSASQYPRDVRSLSELPTRLFAPWMRDRIGKVLPLSCATATISIRPRPSASFWSHPVAMH